MRYLNRAEERAAADLGSAFEDLDRARSLNPASLDPDLAEGRIAISARRYDEAHDAFEHSLTVEDNWLAHFELALIDAGRGRFAPAAADLSRARRPERARPRAEPPAPQHRRPAAGRSQGARTHESKGRNGSLYNVRKVRYVGPGWEKSRPRGSTCIRGF